MIHRAGCARFNDWGGAIITAKISSSLLTENISLSARTAGTILNHFSFDRLLLLLVHQFHLSCNCIFISLRFIFSFFFMCTFSHKTLSIVL